MISGEMVNEQRSTKVTKNFKHNNEFQVSTRHADTVNVFILNELSVNLGTRREKLNSETTVRCGGGGCVVRGRTKSFIVLWLKTAKFA